MMQARAALWIAVTIDGVSSSHGRLRRLQALRIGVTPRLRTTGSTAVCVHSLELGLSIAAPQR